MCNSVIIIIYGRSVVSFFYLLLSSFFLPRLLSAVADWVTTILPHVALVRIYMQVWNALHAARWNTGRKK